MRPCTPHRDCAYPAYRIGQRSSAVRRYALEAVLDQRPQLAGYLESDVVAQLIDPLWGTHAYDRRGYTFVSSRELQRQRGKWDPELPGNFM